MFYPLSVEERMKLIITGGTNANRFIDSFATVMDRTYGWLTNPEHVLVVKFEDLVGKQGGGSSEDQIDSIKRICRWLGRDDGLTNSVAENLFGGTRTFRKGQMRSWENEMPEYLQEIFNERIGKRLGLYNYS